MGDGSRLLTEEINRVVDSPYPTQLKHLRDIVCAKCSNADIARSFRVGACKVDALVVCLLEGLQRWPYVLDIIIRVAQVVAVRNSVLEHEPGFLHDVLVQACKSDSTQSTYVHTAVAMLSAPLPSQIALPAAAQTLFMRLVGHATENPSSRNVKLIHDLLAGTSTILLGLLSVQSLARFQEQLFEILRNSTVRGGQHAEDHSLVLYCLAIIRQVSLASEEQLLLTNSFGATQELLASTQTTSSKWDASAMREYFVVSGKAMKTIQLVVLRVIEACRYNDNTASATSLETLMLANEIVDAFPDAIRTAWCAANPLTVERLQQKVVSTNLKDGARLHALCFIYTLCPNTVLLESRAALQDILIHPERLTGASYDVVDDIWRRCIPGVLDVQAKEKLFRNILGHIVNASTRDLIDSCEALNTLLQGLAHKESDLSGATKSVLGDLHVQRSLSDLSEDSEFRSRTRHDRNVCEQQYQRSWAELVHTFSAVLLRSTLTAEQNTSENMAELLLDLYAGSARHQSTCRHTITQATTKVSFVEQESTPPDVRNDWRMTLQHNMYTQAQTSHDTMLKLFAQACADLEARCESVELPLRQEQARRDELQKEHDQLNQAYVELESQHIDRKLQLDSVQSEREQCMHELDKTRREADQALERVERLQQKLDESEKRAHEEMMVLQRARETSDLEHATTLAQKEAQLEEMQESLDQTNSTLRRKTEELNHSLREIRDLEIAKNDLVTEVERVDSNLRALEVAKTELSDEVTRLGGDMREKEAVVDRLENAMRDASQHHSDLIQQIQSMHEEQERDRQSHESHLQQVKAHGKRSLEAANASHNDTLDRLAVQHGEEIAEIDRKLLHAHHELEQLREQRTLDVAQREERIDELQARIKDLKRDCKHKDRQISEANAMRTNLMAAMGIGGVPAPASLPHRTKSTAPLTQAEYSRLEESELKEPGPRMEYTTGLDGGASFASNASSGESRNGPTPKRARPRKSFKAASPAKARVSTSVKTGRVSLLGRSTAKRQPLVSLSVNQSPSKAAPKTPSKEAIIENADEFNDSTFDENEIFSRTPARHMMEGE